MRFTRSAPLTGGGTINGDLTITGDLTVQGDGAGNYDEIVEGNLVLTSGSKLGVGIGDATPSAPVHVSIAAQDGVSSPLEALRLEVSESFGNVDVGSNQGPAIDFYVPVDSNTSQIGGRIAVGHENGTDTDSAAKLTFTTAPDGASLNASPAITISSTGNVGIGISPLAVFHAKMASNVNFTTTANSSSLRLNAVNDAVDATIQLEINSTDTKFLSPVTIDANATDGTALTIDSEAQDGQGIYMDVSQQTTGYGINIADTGTSRTTGGIIYINSNQNNSGTRNLVDIINNHEGATGATGLKIQQDSSSYAMHISNPTNTTNFGNGLIIATQDENTTSYPLFIKTNSSDADESAGNSRFVVRADGKVGINEINPAAKLQITGGSYNDSLIIKGVSSNSGIQFVDSGGNTDGFAYAENGQIGFLDPGGDWMINAKDDDFIRFAIGANSEKMRIDSSGNVGIGTASPSAKLQIEESTNGADIQFNMRALNDGGTGRTTAIKFDPDARKMHFGEDFTNLILDTSNVRVGIGETPSYKLDVNHGGVSSSDQVIARFMAESSRQLGLVWDDSASTLGLATLTSHNLVFHTGGNSNPRMTIDTSGNVSAGTTATYGNLTVGGTGEIIAGRASSGAGSFSMYEAGTTRFVIESLNGSNGVAFKTPSTARMILDDNSRISLSNNDNNTDNTVFGKSAFNASSNNGSDYNTVFGNLAMGTGTVNGALYNVAVGASALNDITSGDGNTAVGYQSLLNLTDGDGNTAIGNQAMGNGIVTGDNNVVLGNGAGYNMTSAHSSVIIGKDTNPSANTGSNQTVIGYNTTGVADNSVVLGNADVTDVYMAQDSGATVHSAKIKLEHGGSATAPSIYFGDDTNTGIYHSNDNNLRITINGTKAVEIDASRNMDISGSLSTPGILFPDSQSASADANMLDDYEEGTHTCTATNTGGSLTLGNKTLSYTKIGRQVTVSGELSVTGVSAGSGAINFSLPFSVADLSGAGDRYIGAVQTRNVDFPTNTISAGMKASVGGSSAYLFANIDDGVEDALGDDHFANGDEISFTITYFTA